MVSANSSTLALTSVTQLWSFPTTGAVYGSPVVSNGRVYAVSSFIQRSIGYAYCLNASTGVQIWNYTIDTYYYGSLRLLDGIVYIVSTKDSTLHALNPFTGTEKWKYELPDEYANYPAVAEGRVFVTGANSEETSTVYSLDASSGTQIWNRTFYGLLYSPIVDGNHVYVTYYHDVYLVNFPRGVYAGGIYALDASTGSELWNYTLGWPGYPIIADGTVFIATSDYSNKFLLEDPYAIFYPGSVYAFDGSTGTKIWNYTIGGSVGYLAVVNGMVYAGASNGNLYALDASNGKKIWNYTLGELAGAPLEANGYIYVSSSGSVYCLDASTGRKIWNYKTEDTFASSPVVVDGRIYVGAVGNQFFASLTHHNVYAVDAITGKKIWNYTIKGNAHSLAVADGIVYVGSSQATKESPDYEGNGAVYALKPTATSSPPPPTPLSDLQLTVIAAVVIIVILAILFLVYRIRRKGFKSSPRAQLLPKL